MNLQSSVPSSLSWQPGYAQLPGAPFALPDLSVPPSLDDIRFRRLFGTEEINSIKHLREEINLPGAALADPEFNSREKKETKSVL